MYGIINSSEPEHSNEGINDLRTEVDRIDKDILGLLAERQQVAQRIAVEKQRSARPFRDGSREQSLLLDRIAEADRYHLDPGLVSRVWEQIMADSLRVQFEHAQGSANPMKEDVVAAIQGIEGSNSHAAALQLTSDATSVGFVSCDTFGGAVAAVGDGRADIAVLPIDNTTSGAIAEVYDLLLSSNLSIIGEAKLLVEHSLLGAPGATLDGLKTIHGHPQAVAQCSDMLAQLPGVEIVYANDTALSARRIADLGDPTLGAIASRRAADIYGLELLEENINNRHSNYTRFVAVAGSPITVDPQVPAKTSLVISVSNEPGALSDVLAVFRDEDISLVKLESRPTIDNPWEEMFYLDFEGNQGDASVHRALDGVRRQALFLKVLGTYPSRDLRPHRAIHHVEPGPAVRRVVEPAIEPPGHFDDRYPLASRGDSEKQTVVDVGGVPIGGPDLVMIAGPCAVESLDQVMQTARAVKQAGATLLRGGCFKPRTSPYSFQGLGYEALDMLAEAGRVYNLPIVTEVPAPEHVAKIAEKADVLQIGTRNMQNFALLAEVGRSNRPVVLKRGMSASIDELLQAAEYILDAGNQRVILCERGIRTFETSSRNTLDVTAVPVLRERTHLPVIVDPSHAAGTRRLVAPLALAGAAIGADGLMVEVHPEPEQALSDGPQSLTFEDLSELMVRLKSVR